MAETNVYTDAQGNRYLASQDAETGRWETGYRDAAGVWHDVPPNEMPLEAYSDKQLADLKYSKDAGLSPDQRAAVDGELHDRGVQSGQMHTFTDEAGNRYEATQDAETGRWETGYRDAAGVWHDVPPNEMPLEAYSDKQLADLKYSKDAGLSPDQRAAVDGELHDRGVQSGQMHTFTDEAGNRYEATHDAETGRWETGYRDAAGVWHDVPPNEMPLEAYSDAQLEDLKYSKDAAFGPDQRAAVENEMLERASQQAEQSGEGAHSMRDDAEIDQASLQAGQLGEGQHLLRGEPAGSDGALLEDLPMFQTVDTARVDPGAGVSTGGPVIEDVFDASEAVIIDPVLAASGGRGFEDIYDSGQSVIVDPASSVAGPAHIEDIFDSSDAFSVPTMADTTTSDFEVDEFTSLTSQTETADADLYAGTTEGETEQSLGLG